MEFISLLFPQTLFYFRRIYLTNKQVQNTNTKVNKT